MATVNCFEELRVWQKARSLADDIFQLIQKGALGRDYELQNQINRSSGSVMDNIAEGFGRGGRAEFIQFLGYSLGSNDEVKSQLYRALDRNYITQPAFDELYTEVDKLTKMMASFINYPKNTEHKGFKYNRTNKLFTLEELPAIDYEPQTTN